MQRYRDWKVPQIDSLKPNSSKSLNKIILGRNLIWLLLEDLNWSLFLLQKKFPCCQNKKLNGKFQVHRLGIFNRHKVPKLIDEFFHLPKTHSTTVYKPMLTKTWLFHFSLSSSSTSLFLKLDFFHHTQWKINFDCMQVDIFAAQHFSASIFINSSSLIL